MTLKLKFIKGIIWSAFSKFSGQGLQALTTIILARILTPKEFGIIGIANIFIILAGTINQLGIASAIVQKKDVDEQHLSSAFWANVVTGTLLSLIMFLSAKPIAHFFDNVTVQPVLAMFSILFILGALRIVQNALFTKKMEFKYLAIIEVSELGVNAIVAITLALCGYGVWSLVYGRIVGILTGVLLAWKYSNWRPTLYFSFEKFKELFSFGSSVLAVNIFTFAIRNVDYAIIGRALGVIPLGIYTMGYNLVTLPERKMSSIVTSVAFPVFSRIQDDNKAITEHFIKILQHISFITFPVLLGLFAVTPDFVNIILGPKWAGVILPMRILCVLGMLRSIATTMGSIFYAKGRPDIELKLDIVSFIAITIFILIGVRFGIEGVAYAITFYSMLASPVVFYIIARLLSAKFTDFYKAILPALLTSVVMAALVMLCDFTFDRLNLNALLGFVLQIIIGDGSYVALQFIFRIPTINEFSGSVIDAFSSRRLKGEGNES